MNRNVCNASAGASASAEDLPILPREVEAVLRTLNATSTPGGDRLSFGFWKALDPRGEILAELFEICRTSRRVPDQWWTSRVTLICKNPDGDLGEVSNWRPISVCCTLYKIYAAMLARRRQTWALERDVISPEQKGFMPAEGTFEHVFILDTALADSKSAKNNIYVAWLDIKNAFGSIQHECIQTVMRAFGEYLATLLRALQTSTHVTLP